MDGFLIMCGLVFMGFAVDSGLKAIANSLRYIGEKMK